MGLSMNDDWWSPSMAVGGRDSTSWIKDGDDRDCEGGGARLEDRVDRELDGEPGDISG
jgi:hypothetical protein